MAKLLNYKVLSNSLTSGYEFSAVAGIVLSGSIVRSGAYSIEINNLVSLTPQYTGVSPVFTTTGNGYFRFYFRIATAPSADNMIWQIASGELGFSGAISLSSARKLKLLNQLGVQIGSDSSVLNLNQWYMIEVRANDAPSAGSQELELRLDGVSQASSTSETFVDVLSDAVLVVFGGNLNGEAQTQGDWYFDDIAVNDSTGSDNTTWPGQAPLNNEPGNRYPNISVGNGMSRSEGAT